MADTHRRRAREWLARDPDPATRAELSALLDDDDEPALADRFGGRLEFGTAGLRGALGAGPNRMNRVTVMRAAAGLAGWLGPGRTVVVGYDARHRSADFAHDTAAVLCGAGCRALVLPRPLPTPVLAYATRALDADAGVMVTASHNPPRDNGYKVYVGGTGPAAGSQVVPPADTEIATAMDAVGPVDELALDHGWHVLDGGVVDDYLAAVTASGVPLGAARDIAVTYTPLHGVGAETLLAAFERAGFPAPSVVPAQADPDPDFPTVGFPNPEEPGALDLAMAAGHDSDLVLANDPDADRLAVALPGHGLLTGDEVGGLLGEYVLRHTSGAGRVVATTVVSAGLLPKIAATNGVRCVETLTGFKWLVRAGVTDRGDARPVFAYEEALGYCLGGDSGRPVADKDGISAALAVAALAAEAKRDGLTLLDLLDDQARRFGLHRTAQVSVRVRDTSLLAEAMRELRAAPPHALGALEVEGVQDFVAGHAGLPPTDALRYRLGGAARANVTLRPSGTEPKLKAYLEVVLPVDPGHGVAETRRCADTHLANLREAVRRVLPER